MLNQQLVYTPNALQNGFKYLLRIFFIFIHLPNNIFKIFNFYNCFMNKYAFKNAPSERMSVQCTSCLIINLFVNQRWVPCTEEARFKFSWLFTFQHFSCRCRINFNFRDHPFKTAAFFRAEGVKNLPNLSTDSSKRLPMVGVKNLLTSQMDGPLIYLIKMYISWSFVIVVQNI